MGISPNSHDAHHLPNKSSMCICHYYESNYPDLILNFFAKKKEERLNLERWKNYYLFIYLFF